MEAYSCGGYVNLGGDRVNVSSTGRNESDGDDDALVSLAIASGESWRLPAPDVSDVAGDDKNVYTAVDREDRGEGRIRAYAADTGRRRWDVPFHDSEGHSHDVQMMVASGTGLYVLTEDGLYAFDTADGRRRWKSPLAVESSGSFFIQGNTAYVWWDDTKPGLLRQVERTAMAAVDLTTGRRLWWKRTDSGADIEWADGRAAYIASFRKRLFRTDVNELIALDARTGRRLWKRDMDPAEAIAASGIVYVREGSTLRAIDAATGKGP